jgi:serine/threonine protein kinase
VPALLTELVPGWRADHLFPREGTRGKAEVEVALRMLDALGFMHEHGVGLAHNDARPKNVVLTSPATVKLVDFGSSVPAEQAMDLHAGKQVKAVNHDLYCTAATLLYLLTGGPEQNNGQWYEPPAELLQRVVDVKRSGVRLREVIDHGLHWAFPSAGAFADALRPFAEQASGGGP